MKKLRRQPKTMDRGPGAKGTRLLPLGMIAGPAGGLVTALLKNWKMAVFALLIAIIAYQNTVSFELLRPFGLRTIPGLEQDIAKAEEKVRQAQEQVIECDLSRERLKGAIEATNAQVERWAALTNRLQTEQSNLTEELIQLTEQTNTEIQVVLDGPVPQTCEGAIKLLRDAVTEGDLSWPRR